ncbi:hypothetical protein QJS10_CPB04g00696 [Acorus calamus]|uniref:Uncharacterized protein n=1 Tax=Acorus calamus TaxID=4465 RepID=A0AAV9F3L4_ACOCL|nr:hypothetical protein QJS10_CPB04g00696 [Acorus calamus]
MEFNIPVTCFLTPIGAAAPTVPPPVEICGHATLAASHFLFSSGLVEADAVEFVTLSGVLTAKRVRKYERFLIELDFPASEVVECEKVEVPEIPITLGGASVVRVMKSRSNGSGDGRTCFRAVAGIQPQVDEIRKCAGRGVIITGPAPSDSGFDFYTRFFCPKLGVDEDPVCGSAHCALAPYWSKKLGRKNLIAFMPGVSKEWDIEPSTGRGYSKVGSINSGKEILEFEPDVAYDYSDSLQKQLWGAFVSSSELNDYGKNPFLNIFNVKSEMNCYTGKIEYPILKACETSTKDFNDEDDQMIAQEDHCWVYLLENVAAKDPKRKIAYDTSV